MGGVVKQTGDGTAIMTPCGGADSTTWCCGLNNTACCNNPETQIKIPKVLGQKLVTSSSRSTTTTKKSTTTTRSFTTTTTRASSTTTNSTTTASSTATPTSSPDKGGGLPKKSTIGLILGVLVGAIIFLSLILLLVRVKKNQRKRKAQAAAELSGVGVPGGPKPIGTVGVHELTVRA